MNKVFLNRLKSFAWRLSMMIIVVLADYVVQNLLGFGLPPYATIALGLAAGEVSKFFNTELSNLSTQKLVTKKKK